MNNMEAQLPGKNNVEAEASAEASAKAQTSKRRTNKLLRARSKALKKSPASNSLMAKKGKGSLPVEGKDRRKIKKALQGKRESFKIESEDGKNHNPREVNTENKYANKEVIEKEQENEVNQENIAGSSKGQKNKKHEKNQDGSAKNLREQKNKGKPEGRERIRQDERKKEKLERREEIQRDERKKEKHGGLIFMCSAKTKPDCFRYRVMGISMNKKDLVLGLKPGIKLFLYDFDLKLMYGIYEASSSGGLKLEPKAFAGAFPVQVRFRVYKDCFPLPENVFKKAIKENYNKNNKFDTELTVQQVRKLSQLFRPAAFPSAPGHTAPILDREARESRVHPDRELFSRVNQEYPDRSYPVRSRDREARESRVHPDRELFSRVNQEYPDRSYPVRSRERDQYIEYQDSGSAPREEINRDLFMSEKEYRTYGLKGEKRRLTPPLSTSISDPHQTDQERELLLRQTDPIYRHIMPATREAVLANPLYLAPRELHSYNPTRQEWSPPASLIATTVSSSVPSYLDLYTREPYYTYVDGSSSVGAYMPPPRRGEVSSGSCLPPTRREAYLAEADSLHGREYDQLDNLYAKYAADPIANYNHLHNYHTAKPEIAPLPVSSRYSFAGPSLSYRLP